MTEDAEHKLNDLIRIAGEVRSALVRRSIWIALGLVAPLVIGAALMWQINNSARNAENIAREAYLQSLRNNRQNLQYQRDFAQTRDCPVEYFRELLIVSRERGDLTAVQPPCEAPEMVDYDKQIAEVNQIITAEEARRHP